MYGPAVLSWLLAAVAAVAGGLCLLRMRATAAGRAAPGTGGPDGLGRESDAAEAAMGLGMAAMIAAGDRLPPPLWAWLFGLLAAVSLLAAAGGGTARVRAHRLHHSVGAVAMVYMTLAMGSGRPHPGMAMPMGAAVGLPAVTGLLLLYFGGYALWTGSRLLTVTGQHHGAGPAGSLLGAGGLPKACRLAMGVGMFAMLLTL
ncbi:hypothetical protein P3T37_005545 [Kitasatospora sp. MAA4]|uniref:DUF5134 domain-containing protein n=1 Tax=Kitasatospora sp. MAA4 TaxID=3035093 RepID=UPI0024754CE5|nr:DUF5134 domain-containing protein [Kitasatospora sp. MAA4]MDH6136126.1 hypothetical protein [Kitasatospora sp. MAA4]